MVPFVSVGDGGNQRLIQLTCALPTLLPHQRRLSTSLMQHELLGQYFARESTLQSAGRQPDGHGALHGALFGESRLP